MAPLIVAVTTTTASISEPKQNTYQYCKASVYALSDISSLPTITQFAIESTENYEALLLMLWGELIICVFGVLLYM